MHNHIQKAGFLEQKININSAANPTDNLSRIPAAGAIRVAEMFSGPGGIGIALNRTRSDKHHFEHVWATDYDADTMRTYKANVLKGDVAKVLRRTVSASSFFYTLFWLFHLVVNSFAF